jgi:hypothetical protein
MDNTETETSPKTIGPLIPIDSEMVDAMAELIDEYFRVQNKTRYKLNKYSIIEIDEVRVDVYIKIYYPNENNDAEYALIISSQNIRIGRDDNFVIYKTNYVFY